MDRKINMVIKELRENNNLSQDDLAKILGTTRQSVSNYETGKRVPSTEMQEDIADYFNVDMDYLLGRSTIKSKYSDQLEFIGQYAQMHSYPYIENPVAAGVPETMIGIRELNTISLPDYVVGKYAGNKNMVIMKVNGESMNKVIPNGSMIGVIFDYPVNNLKDEDIVVFNHNYEYSLKHFYDAGDKLIFKSNSDDISFTDIVLNKDETVNIVGKVVMYVRLMD